MKLLVTGGAASGKSTWARQLALQLPAPRYVISTMVPCREDSALERSRLAQQQAIPGLIRITQCTDLETLALPQGCTAIVDCLCHLTANEMFDESGQCHDVLEKLLRGLSVLEHLCDNLIVLTNEIGCDAMEFFDQTPSYIQTLGALNAALAQRFDCVCELVCGLVQLRKGSLPQMEAPVPTSQLTLVLGGVASGKRTYARALGYTPEQMSACAEDAAPVLYDLQELAAGLTQITPALLEQLCAKQVILCTEVGSGVIPVDPAVRDARVRTGQLCILLARRARRVVRMICGIPILLKE